MDSQSRQEYVRAAISFLQNPKLVDSPLKDKLKFLKDKGLSELEVDEALNLALVNRHQTQGSRWNFLLILGLCIGGYKLYQSYLEQEKTKKEDSKLKNTDTSIKHPLYRVDEHTVDTSELKDTNNSPTLNEILQKMTELKKLIELQRSNFGTEMQSLKTLLLGHEKFAAPPKIPEWQLASSENTDKDSKQSKAETSVKTKKGKARDSTEPNAPSGNVFIEFTRKVPSPV